MRREKKRVGFLLPEHLFNGETKTTLYITTQAIKTMWHYKIHCNTHYGITKLNPEKINVSAKSQQ